ncbi:MAG: TerC family protein [Ardenticatenaceae bacterium]|nr:TerC family protein [Ardenticatenaceae bacterium]
MELFTTENLIALLTLTALEIVLGIDNVIFVAILAGKLPSHQRDLGRRLGIGLAVVSRILLLLAINWIMRLTEPVVAPFGNALSGRDLILLIGGLFLIGKSTFEIHEKLEAAEGDEHSGAVKAVTLASVITQVVIVDIVFSLDSVITAVGISGVLAVMIPAVVIAAAIMLFASGAVGRFVEEHPTMKMLALSFLILIGSILVIEGWNAEAAHDLHLKNYAYFAMAFSFGVELLNMRTRKKAEKPVKLHNRPSVSEAEAASTD